MLKTIIQQVKLLYSSSLRIRGLAKRITSSTPYFEITRAKIERQRREDLKGPFNLVIETANVCNARCVMCPYQLMKRPKRIMEQKIFEKILTRIKEEKLLINKVFFSGMGEPLTDPDLVFRIREVKKLGLAVRLYTNASLLTSQISQQLVDLEVDEINISFNGTNPHQYRKIMGLNFPKTTKNIESLIRVKRERHSSFPLIQVSLIVIKENSRQIKKHLRNWSGKIESVTVSQAHEWGGGVKIGSRFKVQGLRLTYSCRSLWHTFNIDSKGNFVICCRDYESRYILGNIQTHSFAEIQKSPILEDFRRLHSNYSWAKLPKICQGCNFPYQGGVEWFLPRSID